MTEREIIKQILSWKGTPWLHGQAVKGVGVDCVQFIVAVAKDLGWIPRDFKTVAYNVDHAMHNDNSILEAELEKHCTRIAFEELRPGDILSFVQGRCASHAAYYIGAGKMVHAHIRDGVAETSISELKLKLSSCWRFE
jgi:cell wall-associated NlpC family hydrolase